MPVYTLPTFEQIDEYMHALLDRRVESKKGAPYLPSLKAPGIVGVYFNEQGRPAAVCMMSIAFAAASAAALTRIPATVSAESVKRGKLEANLLENANEVLNIAVNLFLMAGGPRISLKSVHPVPPPLPAPLMAMIMKPPQVVHADVMIDGYNPAGKLSLIST
jgi:hypothetical protein